MLLARDYDICAGLDVHRRGAGAIVQRRHKLCRHFLTAAAMGEQRKAGRRRDEAVAGLKDGTGGPAAPGSSGWSAPARRGAVDEPHLPSSRCCSARQELSGEETLPESSTGGDQDPTTGVNISRYPTIGRDAQAPSRSPSDPATARRGDKEGGGWPNRHVAVERHVARRTSAWSEDLGDAFDQRRQMAVRHAGRVMKRAEGQRESAAASNTPSGAATTWPSISRICRIESPAGSPSISGRASARSGPGSPSRLPPMATARWSRSPMKGCGRIMREGPARAGR